MSDTFTREEVLATLSAMHTQAGTSVDGEYNRLRQAFAHMVARPNPPHALAGAVVGTGAFSGGMLRELGYQGGQGKVAMAESLAAGLGKGFTAGVSDKLAEDVVRLYALLPPEQREEIATRFITEKAQQRAGGGELIAPIIAGD
jgi:hypothetical protein